MKKPFLKNLKNINWEITGGMSATGFNGAVVMGNINGAIGGGVDAIFNGNNLLKGLATGAVIGGAMGGVSYSVRYLVKYGEMENEFKYYNGENTENGQGLEYSNKTLQIMRNQNFTSTEIQEYKVGRDMIGSGNYSQTTDGFFQTTNGNAFAYTTRPNFFSGVSNIHYAKAAFASKALLFTTMVHETAHSYIMYAGNFFVKKYNEIKLFNRGYGTNIDNLGHASIFDMENYLSTINKFKYNIEIGIDHSFITNAVNNNITGNNTEGFNFLKQFLLPVFNRKMR